MIRHGEAPYLECSSNGDRRFSAFYARIKARNNLAIEEIYQASKVFNFDGKRVSGLTWQKAKGRRAENQERVNKLYSELWDEYINEHPELIGVLVNATGLSDMFGLQGHCCQATELWRIRAMFLEETDA